MPTGELENREVTIAIPAFNEEDFIGAAIESAIQQSAMVMVCDNNSTDRTRSICESYVSREANVAYVAHPVNIGALGNFRYALHHARTGFFMWLGAHDMLAPGYVSELLGELRRMPHAVHAFGSVRYIDRAAKFLKVYDYGFGAELGSLDAASRMVAIARYLEDCSLVHGIYRREVLASAWTDEPFLGVDHVLMARVARMGPSRYVPETCYVRRMVRAGYSAREQMERIKPGMRIDATENPYRLMICGQLELFDRLDGFWLRRKLKKLSAAYHLFRRFGPWAKRGTITRRLQRCVQLAGRPVAIINRWRKAI